ncbi:hypothetical protein SDRG_07873 [Saprolegnia diclina VS20]|uniref:SP-RING-type domain-containing protein n=1 Tax=Saprolegnia diclina (strain VS20) TaxID=1156394 RepID=T0QIK6_SAPDV|nr:hypothetical protein SDRG_07873 [Saprolegnia diclina VS20]EQC34546.1 hypothetical protein SDRG_07873 [Saprolegnia diclina VS20]|eukprot:XP_008611952.1 hypothetical protein SDRG_07873 [Saprolegnia diclina VS20]
MDAVHIESLKSRLQGLRIPELKVIMKVMSLSSSGRKQELVDRIYDKVASYQTGLAQQASQSETHATFYKQQMAKAIAVMNEQIGIRSSERGLHHVPDRSPVYKAPIHAPNPIPRHGWNAPLQMPPNLMNQGLFQHEMRPPPMHVAAPSIGSARCMCPGHGHLSAGTTKCKSCTLVVHDKCHLLTPDTGDWCCETCRSKSFDPFFKVLETLGQPICLRFNIPRSQTLTYDLTPMELEALRHNQGTAAGAIELQLRSFALSHTLGEGHEWPTMAQISVNGYPVQVVQRANPGHANVSKVLRELPLNLLPHSRPGRNVVDIRGADQYGLMFGMLVQRVVRESLDSLVETVLQNSTKITYADAKQNVIQSFGNDDDDDIVAMCTMLSVRCPLSLGVIQLPARGLCCQHLQCFDLKTFLMFNKSARSRAWKCIVCHKFIPLDELRIDPFLKDLLSQVADDDELEEVEIFPDATWKKRVDDEVEPKPAKKPKTEDSTDDDESKRAVDVALDDFAPIVDSIDLTLSSDEEDDPAPPRTHAARDDGPQAASGGAGMWADQWDGLRFAATAFGMIPPDVWNDDQPPPFAGDAAAAIDVLSSPVPAMNLDPLPFAPMEMAPATPPPQGTGVASPGNTYASPPRSPAAMMSGDASANVGAAMAPPAVPFTPPPTEAHRVPAAPPSASTASIDYDDDDNEESKPAPIVAPSPASPPLPAMGALLSDDENDEDNFLPPIAWPRQAGASRPQRRRLMRGDIPRPVTPRSSHSRSSSSNALPEIICLDSDSDE